MNNETERRFVVIIWHQAGGPRAGDNKPIYYAWDNDETETARVFPSKDEAAKAWHNERMDELHAGIVVEVTAGNVDFI